MAVDRPAAVRDRDCRDEVDREPAFEVEVRHLCARGWIRQGWIL